MRSSWPGSGQATNPPSAGTSTPVSRRKYSDGERPGARSSTGRGRATGAWGRRGSGGISARSASGWWLGRARSHDLGFVKTIVNDVLLPNYSWLQWVITFVELGVGALLILGLATRAAALVGLGQQLWLQLLYVSSGRWMFEQPHEWVPLLILALVPAGRVWGLDRRFAGCGLRRWRGWPF